MLLKHIQVLICIVVASVAAAPVPSPQLAQLLGPVLAALEPLAQGIDQGVTAGATNVNAALRDAGAYLFRCSLVAFNAQSDIGQAVNQAAIGWYIIGVVAGKD